MNINNDNIHDFVEKYINSRNRLPEVLRNKQINEWDVSRVTNMDGLFMSKINFNEPLDNWNVSNVISMKFMFYNATKFNQPLNNWDVSNVTNMRGMFKGATKFNQPLDQWDVYNVTDAYLMFNQATSFTQGQSLNTWVFNENANIGDMFEFSGIEYAAEPEYPIWFDPETFRLNELGIQRARARAQGQNLPIQETLIQQEDNQLPNINTNINKKGFNFITQEELIIKNFLQEDNNNIVVVINDNSHLLSKNNIRTQLNNQTNLKYGCKQAGNNSSFTLDNNINFEPVYFSLSSVLGLQILVTKQSIETLLNDAHQVYVCQNTNEILPAIMSVAYYNGSGGVSADHCQTGKTTPVYKLIKGNSVEEPVEEPVEERLEEQEHTIKVQYKGFVYDFPVTPETTLNNIKQLLLNKLIEENKIKNNVKFIYTGKVYKDNELNKLLTELQNPPYGITLQSMVNPISGGRLTRKRKTKRRKIKRRKTKRQINKTRK